MAEQLYPKVPRVKPERIDRPWRVEYDMTFDGGGSAWSQYYRTEFGARWSAFWWEHFRSWGGRATLHNVGQELVDEHWARLAGQRPPKAPGGVSGGTWKGKRQKT